MRLAFSLVHFLRKMACLLRRNERMSGSQARAYHERKGLPNMTVTISKSGRIEASGTVIGYADRSIAGGWIFSPLAHAIARGCAQRIYRTRREIREAVAAALAAR